MDLGLDGRVAVVTGGTSGIGMEAARIFLEEGARVAICSRDTERVAAATRDLADRFGADRVLGLACDVLAPEAVARFRDAVAARFGAVDVLVNNAGQARMASFAATSDADWRQELELKFFGIIHPTRAFLPLLERSDRAAIVCVNALLALQPETRLVATSAARAGALSLTKSLSLDLAAKNIRVNSILLGLVRSGQWERRYQAQAAPGESREAWFAQVARERGIPLGRLGLPEEPAAAIVFLASPRAGYITGAALDISGGQAHQL